MNTIKNYPSAKALITSLRSVGYDFEHALCDIIDNSISSKAKKIKILYLKNQNPIIGISDNGQGMTRKELIDAMRYGSKDPSLTRDKDDLGRFGMGLKSASLSQCKKLTVLSLKNKELFGFSWDIDHIEKTDEWDLIELKEIEIEKYLNYFQLKVTGTLVIWENFDRIESDSDLNKTLDSLLDHAEKYVSIIYHRFTDIEITFNNNIVKYIDPLFENHPSVSRLKADSIPYKKSKIDVQGFIIPPKSRMKKSDIQNMEIIQEFGNEQGFYIYRNRRLISWGDWNRFAKGEELTKLARVRVDIPNTLDHIWEVDIMKSKAKVHISLKNRIKKHILDKMNQSKSEKSEIGRRVFSNAKGIWIKKEFDGKFSFEIDPNHEIIKLYTAGADSNKIKNLLNYISNQFPYQSAYYYFNDNQMIDKSDEGIYELLISLKEYLNIENEENFIEKIRTMKPFDSYSLEDIKILLYKRKL